MTGAYVAGAGSLIAEFAGTSAGAATIGGVASAGIGAGLSAALKGKGGAINVPPPPGATMVSAAGQDAAAQTRARQAAAGGMGGTIGAGGQANAGAAFSGVTSGSKSLLGQ